MVNNPSIDPSLLDQALGVNHQRLLWPVLDKKGLKIYLRRDDVVSSIYPGNKFYKLFYNLKFALDASVQAVVSFGGAYSNHLHALAAMGKHQGIATVGFIRGHQPDTLSPTLQDAQSWGMHLKFLSKVDYQQKNISQYRQWLEQEFHHYYELPEGGENRLAIQGCSTIGKAITHHFPQPAVVCCAVGTGTTMAGIITGLSDNKTCLGFSALKGDDTLTAVVQNWLDKSSCKHNAWQIINAYHHGGYAKVTPELLRFMETLESNNGIVLEPVYSAKMCWGIEQLALQDYWPRGTTLILVHGGGLQGRRGYGYDVNEST